ncbi:MAG: DinB family protein [Chitinophagaceae bacterium]
MLKRTKGRLLLTLLVVTGLAGKMTDTTITSKERKFLVSELKDTKSAIQSTVKGLSDAQLNYKSAPDRWSIRECVYHITLAESNLWNILEAAMKNPPTPEKRKEVTVSDDALLKGITDRSEKRQAPETIRPDKAPWKNTQEALAAFKLSRNNHLKYAKTTTEDLRNHIIELPFGKVDAYQFMLFMAGHSQRHLLQIKEIKADPGFPKQ